MLVTKFQFKKTNKDFWCIVKKMLFVDIILRQMLAFVRCKSLETLAFCLVYHTLYYIVYEINIINAVWILWWILQFLLYILLELCFLRVLCVKYYQQLYDRTCLIYTLCNKSVSSKNIFICCWLRVLWEWRHWFLWETNFICTVISLNFRCGFIHSIDYINILLIVIFVHK